jgi:hypothetical protein
MCCKRRCSHEQTQGFLCFSSGIYGKLPERIKRCYDIKKYKRKQRCHVLLLMKLANLTESRQRARFASFSESLGIVSTRALAFL